MGRKRKRNNEDSQDDDLNFIDDDSKPAIERNAANERERARMRVLSRAFHKLKTSLPWVPPDTKLSKLDTLRLASCYIAHLSRLLAEDGDEGAAATVRALSLTDSTSQLVKNIVSSRLPDENFTTTTKLTWPFSLPTMRSPQLESVVTTQEILPF